MNWEDLYKQRKQTFGFHRTPVGPEKIRQALEIMHEYIPSKNDIMPFCINYYDYSDPEFRKKLYLGTLTPDEEPLPNPQSLAPEILVFSHRGVAAAGDSQIEIGIAAMFLAYQFTSMGIDYGYCRCFDDKIVNPLIGYPVELLIGVGYSSGKTYYNTVIEQEQKTPIRKYPNKRPALDEYIRGLYE